jgi:hypothetical protein
VLTELNTFSETLKNEAEVSVGFIRRHALDPLATLAKRFKGHAIGIAALATSGAIIDWLKGMEVEGIKRVIDLIRAHLGF